MNLAEHLNLFYQNLNEGNTNKFPIALLKEWFNECERVVNKRAPLIYAVYSDTAVADQGTYNLSNITDLLDFHITDIYYADSTSSSQYKRLVPVSMAQLDKWDRLWHTRTGTPAYWYIDPENSKYGLYRYESNPSVTTDAIRILYRKKHTKMTRYYTTGTASITNGTTALTGSGTAWSTNVEAGDQIGFGELLDASRTTDFPAEWYTVDSVDSDTGITLTSAFGETTVSGGSYIACSDSSITYDELNHCTILLAMGKAKFKDKEYDIKRELEQEAYSRIYEENYTVERVAASKEKTVPDYTLPYAPNLSDDYGLR